MGDKEFENFTKHERSKEAKEEDHVDQPTKRQLQQGIMSSSLLTLSSLVIIVIILIVLYLLWKKRKNNSKKQATIRRRAMIKLPMLLSKPKKDYRSVSKTDLLKEQQEPHQENATDSGDFYEYDEIRAGNEEIMDEGLGGLMANIQYDFENCHLIVTIEKFVDKMFYKSPDCDEQAEKRSVCIALSMTPDTQHEGKTNSLETTSDEALFEQQFVFKNIHFNRFQILCLHFKVVIDDTVVGEASQDISKLDKSLDFANPVSLNLNVNPITKQDAGCDGAGELLMSLCYQPAAKRLSVVVLKARNVPKMDITGFSDPYVKIYLHHQNFRSSKKKTHIKKRSLNPVFNESFIFDLPSKDGSLDQVHLEVIMCDWDRITKNETIGRIILGGPDCEGTALTHWEEIQKNPRRPIAQWHKLAAASQ